MAVTSNEALAATIYSFGLHVGGNPSYATSHPGEAAAALAAWALLKAAMPELTSGGPQAIAQKIAAMAQKYLSGSKLTPAAPSPVPMPYPNSGGPADNNLSPEQKSLMELQQKMQRESLMSSVLTNIANMKHEQLKAIAQNLRG